MSWTDPLLWRAWLVTAGCEAEREAQGRGVTGEGEDSAATDGLRDELTAVTRQLADAGQAIDRYLNAFERGTFDANDSHVGARLTELKEKARRRGHRLQQQVKPRQVALDVFTVGRRPRVSPGRRRGPETGVRVLRSNGRRRRAGR